MFLLLYKRRRAREMKTALCFHFRAEELLRSKIARLCRANRTSKASSNITPWLFPEGPYFLLQLKGPQREVPLVYEKEKVVVGGN